MNRTLLFVHIPKTGGLSFRRAVTQNLRALSLPHNVNLKAWGPDAQLAEVVVGHMPYGIHEFMGNRKYDYLTILRHPVERAFSNFYYFPRSRTGQTIKEFLEGPDGFRIKNTHIRQLCGKSVLSTNEINKEDYEQAMANLENFRYVGFTKQLGKLFDRVKKDYGLRTSLGWVNKTRNNTLSKLSGPDVELLTLHNKWDIKLFEEASKRYD